MADPGAKVDYVAMGRAAQQVRDATEVINGLENQVDTHLANLLGGWKGEASTKFAGLLNEWLLDFRNIRQQLETMVEKLHGTAQQYQVTEQDEQAGLNQLSAVLNRR
jgi:WXG100 family type VII secretion target